MNEHETPYGQAPPAAGDAPAPDQPPAPEPDPQGEDEPVTPARSLEERVAAIERQLGIVAAGHPAVGRPTVTLGSADPAVTELTAKLNELGYECPVGPTVTEDVLQAVNGFRRANDVDDDEGSIPEGYTPDVRRRWIGPETWAAVLTA